MLDRTDRRFATELETEIRRRLQGDKDEPGLYRQILGSNDWDTFVRTKGIIFAYEEVLDAMRGITRRMNEED